MDKEKIKGRAENELDDMEIFRLLDDVSNTVTKRCRS